MILHLYQADEFGFVALTRILGSERVGYIWGVVILATLQFLQFFLANVPRSGWVGNTSSLHLLYILPVGMLVL